MALDLTVDLSLNDAEDSLLLEDTTGLYNASSNPGGYGSANSCAVNDVDTVTVTLSYTKLGITLIYVFTVVNGTITAATSQLASATPVNILAELASTVWPFTTPFDLTADYGVTLPDLEDAAYTVTYKIVGEFSATPFEYTTDDSLLVTTDVCCCISESMVNQDINNVNEVKLTGAMRADAYLKIAEYALAAEDTTKANDFIDRADEICDCNCNC